MHVIFGGAFNGKRAYVEQRIEGRNVQWINAQEEIPVLLSNTEVIVVFGIETELEAWLERLERWSEEVEVIVIATEIGRGIVPMEASMRKLRDDIGRFYQQLFAKAESVTRMWYGISQTIKGDVWK